MSTEAPKHAVIAIVLGTVILSGCGRSERVEGPAKLAELRTTIHGFVVGPGDYSNAPPEWRNTAGQPCECGDVCRLETTYIGQVMVLNRDTPAEKCGVERYVLYTEPIPELISLGLEAPAFELTNLNYEQLIAEYGPPTKATPNAGGFFVVYCTRPDGSLLDDSETQDNAEIYSYGFHFSLRKLFGVAVHWTDVCDPNPFPVIPD